MKYTFPTLRANIANLTHLQITSKSLRNNAVAMVSLVGSKHETPAIRVFEFKVDRVYADVSQSEVDGIVPISSPSLENRMFGFKAGQWIDLFVPNISQVGGFSLISTPLTLSTSSTLQLAIKHTQKSQIVKHLFHTARPSDTFYMRVGGEFFYRDQGRPVLLVAGGVGIAPLFSILSHVLETQCKVIESGIESGVIQSGVKRGKVKVKLLYSYELVEERVFKQQLKMFEEKFSNFSVEYYCTEDDDSKRMSAKDVKRAFDAVNPISESNVEHRGENKTEQVDVYLCGPPSFESNMLLHLEKLPVKIYHEKWW